MTTNDQASVSTRPRSSADSKVSVPTTPLQAFDKQLTTFEHRLLDSTDSKQQKRILELGKRIIALTDENTKKLQSDVKNLAVLHSVAVDRHEVLSTLVLNIGHKHNELAEFVRQLSHCASADDVIELKAIVECMARVTGVSEHKAEQLITQFIGRESEELEQLKREQRLADDKIRELQLAKDRMAEMYDSPYQNQQRYLNFVTETMQRECEKYKHDLNAMDDKLGERLNAKVAQAVQRSLVDKHQQNNEAQFDLPSTESQNTIPRPYVTTCSSGKISTEMVQTVVDDGKTYITTTTTAARLEDDIKTERHQVTDTQVKRTAIIIPLSPAMIPAKTSPTCTRVQRKEQPSISNKPFKLELEIIKSKLDAIKHRRRLEPDQNPSMLQLWCTFSNAVLVLIMFFVFFYNDWKCVKHLMVYCCPNLPV